MGKDWIEISERDGKELWEVTVWKITLERALESFQGNVLCKGTKLL